MKTHKKYFIASIIGALAVGFTTAVCYIHKHAAHENLLLKSANLDSEKNSPPKSPISQTELTLLPYVNNLMTSPNLLNLKVSMDSNDMKLRITNSIQLGKEASKDSQQKLTEEKVLSLVTGLFTGQENSVEWSKAQQTNYLSILLNKEASLNDRCKAAWALAKNGDAEAFNSLEKILFDPDSPASLRASIAEGLGYSTDPRAKELILSALADENDIIVRGAIRGLSAIGGKDVIPILSDILFSKDTSGAVLAEAAMGLGRIDNADAYEILVNAYNDAIINENTGLGEDIIAALGQRNIAEISSFFQQIMDDDNSDSSLRVAVIEALEETQGNTTPFLLKSLYDQDSEVRAAAAWALAVAEEPGNLAVELQAFLAVEQDAEVRKRLYQALGNQENVDFESIAALVILDETGIETQLAGYDLLARHVAETKNPDFLKNFNQIVIPHLQEIALTADNLSTRLSAVIALKKANTKESALALEEIAAKSSDMRVVEAATI